MVPGQTYDALSLCKHLRWHANAFSRIGFGRHPRESKMIRFTAGTPRERTVYDPSFIESERVRKLVCMAVKVHNKEITSHGREVAHQGNALQILRDCVLLTRIGETAACSTRFHAIRGAPTKGLSVDVPRRNAYSVEAHRSTPISFYFISTECPRSSGVEPCCQSELNTSCGGGSPSLRAHS